MNYKYFFLLSNFDPWKRKHPIFFLTFSSKILTLRKANIKFFTSIWDFFQVKKFFLSDSHPWKNKYPIFFSHHSLKNKKSTSNFDPWKNKHQIKILDKNYFFFTPFSQKNHDIKIWPLWKQTSIQSFTYNFFSSHLFENQFNDEYFSHPIHILLRVFKVYEKNTHSLQKSYISKLRIRIIVCTTSSMY